MYKFLPVQSSWQLQSNHDNWACGGFMHTFVYLNSQEKDKNLTLTITYPMNKLNMSLALYIIQLYHVFLSLVGLDTHIDDISSIYLRCFCQPTSVIILVQALWYKPSCIIYDNL